MAGRAPVRLLSLDPHSTACGLSSDHESEFLNACRIAVEPFDDSPAHQIVRRRRFPGVPDPTGQRSRRCWMKRTLLLTGSTLMRVLFPSAGKCRSVGQDHQGRSSIFPGRRLPSFLGCLGALVYRTRCRSDPCTRAWDLGIGVSAILKRRYDHGLLRLDPQSTTMATKYPCAIGTGTIARPLSIETGRIGRSLDMHGVPNGLPHDVQEHSARPTNDLRRPKSSTKGDQRFGAYFVSASDQIRE